MQTSRKVLIQRKQLKKNEGKSKGVFKFIISVNTYIDNPNATITDEVYSSKEMIILEVYSTSQKDMMIGDHKRGKDFEMSTAKHILHNKKVIEAIADLYYEKPKSNDNAYRLCDYLPSINSLLGDILIEIKLKGENR